MSRIIKNRHITTLTTGLIVLLFNCSCRQADYSGKLDTYQTVKKDFEKVITETGEIGSEIESDVIVPFSTKVDELIDEGTIVPKNSVIGKLAITKETEEMANADLSYREAEFDENIALTENKKKFHQLTKELENAELDHKIASLKLKKLTEDRNRLEIIRTEESLKTIDREIAIYNMDITEGEKLFKAGYLSEEELNKSKAKLKELSEEKKYLTILKKNLEKGPQTEEIEKEKVAVSLAMENYNKALREIENYRQQSVLDLKNTNVKKEKSKEKYNYFKDLVNLGNLKATASGIVVYGKMVVGEEEVKVKAGDSVKEGVSVIKIFDLKKPVLRMQINEVDVKDIDKELNVRFYLDAFPEKTFTGKIIKIAPLAVKKYEYDQNDVVVFELIIQINENDKTLLPGMTANVEIISHKLKNVITVPTQALQKAGDKTYCFVKSEKGFLKKEVKTGMSNELETIITGGLSEGETVALNFDGEV